MRYNWLSICGLILMSATAAEGETTSLPTYISTPSGFMHTEDKYLPGVTHAELGWFTSTRTESIKAQSIAARTYVLRYLNAKGHSKMIPALGPSFQAWTGKFSSASKASSKAVAGQVMTYGGAVIYANYASGAWKLNSKGWPFAPSTYKYPASYTWAYITSQFIKRRKGEISSSTWKKRVTSYNAWAWTYILNTDNEDKSGDAVTATIHVNKTARNRGGLGQYRAYWLDLNRDYKYTRILRAFYGADITIVGASDGGGSGGTTGKPDLTPTSLTTVNADGDDIYVATGHSIRFRCTVKNAGTAAISSAVPIDVTYHAGGTVVGHAIAFVDLAPGASTVIGTDSGDWKPSTPGVTKLAAIVDADGAIDESKESNNRISLGRTVNRPVEVTAYALNVRTGPGTSYARTGLVRRGQRYVAMARSGDWYKIYFSGGKSVWCHGGYLKTATGVKVVRVTASSLNVRRGPSTSYSKKASGTRGQLFVRISGSGTWHKIWIRGGSGWCSGTKSSYSVTLGF